MFILLKEITQLCLSVRNAGSSVFPHTSLLFTTGKLSRTANVTVFQCQYLDYN